MAIRIRNVNGVTVALCAVEADPMPGDVYLDDAAHHALSTKFGLDWQSMGFIDDPPIDTVLASVMDSQKVRDAKEELAKWHPSPDGTDLFGKPLTAEEVNAMPDWGDTSDPKWPGEVSST